MARKSTLSSLKELSEINNTPLIDLSMLLLITFLITYPLMEQGIHVNLPTGKTDELEPQQARTITVNVKGELFLDNEPVTIEELAAKLQQFHSARPDGTVFVRADRDIRYGRVVDVMKALHGAQISRMALVTQAE